MHMLMCSAAQVSWVVELLHPSPQLSPPQHSILSYIQVPHNFSYSITHREIYLMVPRAENSKTRFRRPKRRNLAEKRLRSIAKLLRLARWTVSEGAALVSCENMQAGSDVKRISIQMLDKRSIQISIQMLDRRSIQQLNQMLKTRAVDSDVKYKRSGSSYEQKNNSDVKDKSGSAMKKKSGSSMKRDLM
ncbi:glycerophosphoryl diester phosphodiesterase 3 [Dorcoceras hygrometricum]|uniref:Glycerophosphoryl diester phosphodiesterase 3 n=1 Tax=Dorcoceras hygrometricum TaxID=472368 RepID=A0A2Z7BQ66_9LAMI|nr:glycerophosphoryl diester phosphodiesterase 3 [Dorcoceras hygrometricum]